jgi:transposase-like protein
MCMIAKPLIHWIKCLFCKWEHVRKHWYTKHWTQRFVCHDCKKTFVTDGERPTYTDDFKENVVKWHVVNGMWILQVCRQHNISTSTLYIWIEQLGKKKANKHQKN